MTNTYHATPYDISATGFYFKDFEEYEAKAEAHRNSYGDPVEEYEIQYIDGDDCALFNALSINQANLEDWFDDFEDQYDGEELIKILYLADDMGLSMAEIDSGKLDEVMVFEGTMEEYAEQYLDETGINDAVEKAGLSPFYIDVEAYARDMEINGGFTKVDHGGSRYIVEYLA